MYVLIALVALAEKHFRGVRVKRSSDREIDISAVQTGRLIQCKRRDRDFVGAELVFIDSQ